MADIDEAVELARRCLDVGGADYNECDLNTLARAVLAMAAVMEAAQVEGDAEQRSSQTCACSSAYREIGPGIHAKYCALAGQHLDDGRQRWRCTACDSVSTVDRCPQCGGASVQDGRS